MRESLFESLVGVLVVAVAGIFLYFSLQQRSEAAPADSYQLIAKFNRVDGISTGSDVRMAGVKIGAVNAIALDPKTYKAVVNFTVKKGVQVPDDSTAQVLSDGLFGGAYLGIMVGGRSTTFRKAEPWNSPAVQSTCSRFFPKSPEVRLATRTKTAVMTPMVHQGAARRKKVLPNDQVPAVYPCDGGGCAGGRRRVGA